jgi:hypothetical protein
LVAHSGPKTRALSNAPAHSSCVRFSKIRLSPAARHPAGCPLDSLVPRRARAHLSVSGDVNSRDLFGFRKSGSKNFLRFRNPRFGRGLRATISGLVPAPPFESVSPGARWEGWAVSRVSSPSKRGTASPITCNAPNSRLRMSLRSLPNRLGEHSSARNSP